MRNRSFFLTLIFTLTYHGALLILSFFWLKETEAKALKKPRLVVSTISLHTSPLSVFSNQPQQKLPKEENRERETIKKTALKESPSEVSTLKETPNIHPSPSIKEDIEIKKDPNSGKENSSVLRPAALSTQSKEKNKAPSRTSSKKEETKPSQVSSAAAKKKPPHPKKLNLKTKRSLPKEIQTPSLLKKRSGKCNSFLKPKKVFLQLIKAL